MQRQSRLTDAFLARAESSEVLRLDCRDGAQGVSRSGRGENEAREGERTVFGTTSAKISMMILPALLPLTVMSKKTRGFAIS